MASKETGSLNEVTADGKSSRSSEVYRATLSVRKILQKQQDDASFGDKLPESDPRVAKGEETEHHLMVMSVTRDPSIFSIMKDRTKGKNSAKFLNIWRTTSL